MDAFYSTSSAAYGAAPGAGWGYESLKNFRQITPAVQTHLKLVRLADSALLLSRSSEMFPSPDFCLFLSSCQGLRAGFVSLYHRVISRAVRGGMRLRIRALSWFRGVNLTVILGDLGEFGSDWARFFVSAKFALLFQAGSRPLDRFLRPMV